ncbi:MAG: TraR/DksA family transcriptional regulator [Oligoflexia bacterium]|nr:TraR/DksA family transcriptional regulator [Oligoflexia bacterium]
MTNTQNSNNKNFSIHPEVTKRLTKPIAIKLYKKLINKKAELSNRPFASKHALSHLGREKGGDQADQVNRLQEEAKYTGQMQRDLLLLEKILQALERMENGRYGICEQTEEVIELKRLESLPWTTLSIEGAEIAESENLFRQVR